MSKKSNGIVVEFHYFMNGHGVEYTIVKYGWKDAVTYCLETVYSKHVRTIELEIVPA